tara:strand:+ start:199 stop:636 length:438 start_codon:yes stop_codon:yes gene_type:complete
VKHYFFGFCAFFMLGCTTKYETPIVVHGPLEGDVSGYVIQEVDQARYIGYVKNGKPHGEGTMYLKDKMILTGSWVNGELNGSGVIISIDVDNIAVGKFVDGVQQGEGYLTANGLGYYGAVSDGLPSGIGDCYQDGSQKKCDPLNQ